MKNVIVSLVIIILGFALIVITIVFKDGLSEDHCAVIGIMGFITMISGVRLSTYSDD